MTDNNKIDNLENIAVSIMLCGFVMITIFLFSSLYFIYKIANPSESSTTTSSILSFLSSIGVFATLIVYWLEKICSDKDRRENIKKKESSIEILLKADLAKIKIACDELSLLMEHMEKNKTVDKKTLVFILDSQRLSCINILKSSTERKLDQAYIIPKTNCDILKGILLNSTDINKILYSDIISYLDAANEIKDVLDALFSLAKTLPVNKNVDNNTATCDIDFLEVYFLGRGTSDTTSQLRIKHQLNILNIAFSKYKLS